MHSSFNNSQIIQLSSNCMKQNSRILPHLNMIYLQRKSYQAHMKKIGSIKRSMSSSKKDVHSSNKIESFEEWKKHSGINQSKHKIHFDPNQSYQMATIKEVVQSPRRFDYMTPFDKRQFLQQKKQNQRLQNIINHPVSTFKRKEIINHNKQNSEIKNRISKFKNQGKSKKVLLKCEYSLSILEKKEKDKFKEVNSEISRLVSMNSYKNLKRSSILSGKRSEIKSANLQNENHSQLDDFQRSPNQTALKKQSFDNIYLNRNARKIRNHFDKDCAFADRANAKVLSLKESYQHHKLRSITQISRDYAISNGLKNKVHQFRNKTQNKEEHNEQEARQCFTTQINQPYLPKTRSSFDVSSQKKLVDVSSTSFKSSKRRISKL